MYICVSEILKHQSNGLKIKLTIFPKIKVKKSRLENQRIITVQHLIKEAPTWRIGKKKTTYEQETTKILTLNVSRSEGLKSPN